MYTVSPVLQHTQPLWEIESRRPLLKIKPYRTQRFPFSFSCAAIVCKPHRGTGKVLNRNPFPVRLLSATTIIAAVE